MRNKNLDEIRPPRTGVKIRNRKPPSRKQAPQRPPKVVKDVAHPHEELPPPTEEAARIVAEAGQARQELMEAVRNINRNLMSSTVLPENRSAAQENAEKGAVRRLWDAAAALEAVSPGEGLLGMATLAVRQGLLLRDAGNRLAHKVAQLEREMARLKRGAVGTDETG
jgi:hypothetical protein